MRGRAVLLALVVVVVFGPGLAGGMVWDDHYLLEGNALLRAPFSLSAVLGRGFVSLSQRSAELSYAAYWRPWVSLFYHLGYRVFGLQTALWHATSLALHVAVTTLSLGWIERRLPPSPSTKLAATLGAAVFALHPSRVENVSWIAGLTDLWAALWMLLAVRAWELDRTAPGAWKAAGWTLLAMASKEAAVVLPVLLAVDDWLLGRRDRARWHLGVVAGAVALMLVARTAVLQGGQTLAMVGVVPRVLASIGMLTAMVLKPAPWSMLAGWVPVDGAGVMHPPAWSVVLGAATLLVAVGVAVLAWRRPSVRPWAADGAWFVVALGPVVNVVPLGLLVLVSPRFLYVPLLGVGALVARGLVRAPRAALLGATALVLAMATVTIGAVGRFVSDEDLWAGEVSVDATQPLALSQLASQHGNGGRAEVSLGFAMRAHAAALARGDRRTETSAALRAVAELAALTPDADTATLEAIARFWEAFRAETATVAVLETSRVRLSLPLAAGARTVPWRVSWAVSQARLGRYEAARAMLLAMVQLEPSDRDAWRNLLLVEAGRGHWDEGLTACQRAMALAPGDAMTAQLCRAVEAGAHRPLTGVPLTDALDEAQRLDALGLRTAARQRLQRWMADPAMPEALVLTLARIDLHDRQPLTARTRLSALPSSPEVMALRAEVEAAMTAPP